jgi:hypothetical protein
MPKINAAARNLPAIIVANALLNVPAVARKNLKKRF